MMVVRAVMVQDMQRNASILRQRLEELAHQLGVEGADLRRGKIDVPHEEGSAGNIDGGLGHRLVHGKIERGITGNAAPVAQRPGNGLADGDAGIFHGVMVIDMQIALNLDLHVDQRMAAELVQHMVEKSHAGGNCRFAGAVDIHAHRNRGFVGLADNLAFTFCHFGRSVKMLPFLISTGHKYPVVPSSCLTCRKRCVAGKIAIVKSKLT